MGALHAATLAAAFAGVVAAEPAIGAGALEHAPYGKTQGGQAVDIYTMSNDHGMARSFSQLWRRHFRRTPPCPHPALRARAAPTLIIARMPSALRMSGDAASEIAQC